MEPLYPVLTAIPSSSATKIPTILVANITRLTLATIMIQGIIRHKKGVVLRFIFFPTCVHLALHTCLLRMLRLSLSSRSTCIVCMFSSFLTHVDHAFTLLITCVLHMPFTIYTVDRYL